MNNYDKINYRQKGRSVDGKVVKGFIQSAHQKLSTGSIPSKFETIIYKNTNNKAFGSSSGRFFDQEVLKIQKTTPKFIIKIIIIIIKSRTTNQLLGNTNQIQIQLHFLQWTPANQSQKRDTETVSQASPSEPHFKINT